MFFSKDLSKVFSLYIFCIIKKILQHKENKPIKPINKQKKII